MRRAVRCGVRWRRELRAEMISRAIRFSSAYSLKSEDGTACERPKIIIIWRIYQVYASSVSPFQHPFYQQDTALEICWLPLLRGTRLPGTANHFPKDFRSTRAERVPLLLFQRNASFRGGFIFLFFFFLSLLLRAFHFSIFLFLSHKKESSCHRRI